MLIAYEDHVSLDSTTLALTVGSLVSGTLDSLVTRQLAETVELSSAGFFTVRATFDQDRSVRIAAALNYSKPDDGMIITLRDSGGGLIKAASTATLDFDSSIYTVNYIVVFDQTYTNVRTVDFSIGASGAQTLGRLWCGPAFIPSEIQALSFGFGVADPSGLSTSRGGQAYSDPYGRLRTLTARLPALTESEAFGDATDSSVINAQDMLFTVGRHRELILIPYEGNSSLIHKWGLYGHLTGYSDIVPVRPGDATIGRLFELSLNAIEER